MNQYTDIGEHETPPDTSWETVFGGIGLCVVILVVAILLFERLKGGK